jgi:hypothetical protein
MTQCAAAVLPQELRAACLDELDKIESDLQQEEREDNDLRWVPH